MEKVQSGEKMRENVPKEQIIRKYAIFLLIGFSFPSAESPNFFVTTTEKLKKGAKKGQKGLRR